jgi:F420-0:gamma-glutamyl ligase
MKTIVSYVEDNIYNEIHKASAELTTKRGKRVSISEFIKEAVTEKMKKTNK